MKLLKEYGIYLLIIILLIAAIVWSVVKTNKTASKVDVSKTKNQTESGYTKADGSFVKTTNLSGKVVVWQSKGGYLNVKLDGAGLENYVIDPSVTTVMVPTSQHSSTDTQLYILKKAEGLHWQSAFCVGDTVSLMIDGSQKIVTIINTGNRICGYKGPFE